MSELPYHHEMVPLGVGARYPGTNDRAPFRLPELQTRAAERRKVHCDTDPARQTGISAASPRKGQPVEELRPAGSRLGGTIRSFVNWEPRILATGRTMCEKCINLDKKIERYRKMASRVNDQITVAGLAELVADLIARKAELHPET
jgi:hypothetical protein